MSDKSSDRPLPDENELMGLVELQKFLADELSSIDPDAEFSRSFLPLTKGLGLNSTSSEPVEKTPSREKRIRDDSSALRPREPVSFIEPERAPRIREPQRTPVPSRVEEPVRGSRKEDDEEDVQVSTEELLEKLRRMPPPQEHRPRRTSAAPSPKVESKGLRNVIAAEPSAEPVKAPPPVPKVTFIRRLGAGLVDQGFVLTFFAIAVFITLRLVGPAGGSFTLGELVRPVIIRLAALEFATIWLCYLSVCLGVLDMTFGMWVWGIRVAYPSEIQASRFLRKVMRIFCTFLFFAPVLPGLILVFRFRGRTLLDLLSGTRLYRSGI